MSHVLYYYVFKTPAGWVGVLGSGGGLKRLTLPGSSEEAVHKVLNAGGAVPSPQRFRGLVERLRVYFAGGKVDFPEEVDLSAATAFQREVWEATRLIPWGETRSYAWLAERIGKPRAVRAVGNALGRNPLPVIIPCHRVLASNGRLGGFSGGLAMKKYLLCLENSVII